MFKVFNGTAVSMVAGPVLAPFCWAADSIAMLVDRDPTLVADLLRLRRVRMHLIALALAHLKTDPRPELGRFLLCGRAGEVVTSAIGRGPPAGLSRALAHMPSCVLERENYRHLIELLDHQANTYLLFYPDSIDNSIIELLYRVLAPLRRPALLLAMRRGGGFAQLAGLTEGLAVLAARGTAASLDALVAELGLAWGPGQFATIGSPSSRENARFIFGRTETNRLCAWLVATPFRLVLGPGKRPRTRGGSRTRVLGFNPGRLCFQWYSEKLGHRSNRAPLLLGRLIGHDHNRTGSMISKKGN